MKTGCQVLITGVNGFVGWHMAAYLLSRRMTVLGIGRRPADLVCHPQFRYNTCDLRDRAQVCEWMAKHAVDYVIHLAAETDVQRWQDDPVSLLTTNCMGTLHLLEAIRLKQRERVKGILVVGSSHEYGMGAGGDLSEETPLAPNRPYGWSKLMTTSVAKMYAELYGLPIVIARTFNVIGPGASAGVCATLARQVAEIERGARPPRLAVGNQAIERDFVDVRDVVAAYWSLLTAARIRPGEVYNVASGTSRRIGAMVEIFRRHAQRPFEVVTDEALLRHGEPLTVRGENRKLREATAWLPKRSFEQSVLDVLAHARRAIQDTTRPSV